MLPENTGLSELDFDSSHDLISWYVGSTAEASMKTSALGGNIRNKLVLLHLCESTFPEMPKCSIVLTQFMPFFRHHLFCLSAPGQPLNLQPPFIPIPSTSHLLYFLHLLYKIFTHSVSLEYKLHGFLI